MTKYSDMIVAPPSVVDVKVSKNKVYFTELAVLGSDSWIQNGLFSPLPDKPARSF